MNKTIVYEKDWLRGESSSLLLDEQGGRCCIGFSCQQAGVPDKDLLLRWVVSAIPINLETNKTLMDSGLRKRGIGTADWVLKAYYINDDPEISDEERKLQLIKLGLENNHEFVFVPGHAPK